MTRILAALVRPAIANNFKPIVLAQAFSKSCANYDHYDTLRVPNNATYSQIEAAYKQLSALYSSDKNKDNTEAYNKLRKINAAYNVLSNYQLRRLYNEGFQLGNIPKHSTGPKASSEEIATIKPQKIVSTESTSVYNRPHVDEWSRAHTADVLKDGIENKKRLADDANYKIEKFNSSTCAIVAICTFFTIVLVVNYRAL